MARCSFPLQAAFCLPDSPAFRQPLDSMASKASLQTAWGCHFYCSSSQAERRASVGNTPRVSLSLPEGPVKVMDCWDVRVHYVVSIAEACSATTLDLILSNTVHSLTEALVFIVFLFLGKKLQDVHTMVCIYFKFGSFAYTIWFFAVYYFY